MLARQDGRRPRVRNDRNRVREACLASEERYGLRRTAPGDRTAACRASRAESETATRRGLAEAPRVILRRLVRTAVAAAASEQEFFTCLRRSGVLVRTRSSVRQPSHLTGYAVALPGDTAKAGEPVWYSGGKLAADLTLPKLRHRWGLSCPAFSGQGICGYFTRLPARSGTRPGLLAVSGTRAWNGDESDYSGARSTAQYHPWRLCE